MTDGILDKIIGLALVFFSVILHEIAHGYVAWRLGDPTARMRGRLTLNPFAHVDLFGTIIVPLMLSFSGAPVLGWAKPVPINPSYFEDTRRGIMLTGIAGPVTNFLLAAIAVLALNLFSLLPVPLFIQYLLVQLVVINIWLGLFNLIPIPPLDGSRVAVGLIPPSWIGPYLKLERFGFLILLGLLYLNVIDYVLEPIVGFILKILF